MVKTRPRPIGRQRYDDLSPYPASQQIQTTVPIIPPNPRPSSRLQGTVNPAAPVLGRGSAQRTRREEIKAPLRGDPIDHWDACICTANRRRGTRRARARVASPTLSRSCPTSAVRAARPGWIVDARPDARAHLRRVLPGAPGGPGRAPRRSNADLLNAEAPWKKKTTRKTSRGSAGMRSSAGGRSTRTGIVSLVLLLGIAPLPGPHGHPRPNEQVLPTRVVDSPRAASRAHLTGSTEHEPAQDCVVLDDTGSTV